MEEIYSTSGPTLMLTGFGDEIDDDPELQCVVMQALGASHIEIRSAWRTNVLSLDDEQIDRLRECLNRRSMRVSSIASPIGKIDISVPVADSLASLERAIMLARIFEASYIRIFSFYRSSDQSAEEIRDAVLERIADEVAVLYLGRVVESGPARAVFEEPRHPYTQALLKAAFDVVADTSAAVAS